ncbi:MAG: hypothetical protein Q4E68_00500 [Prevotellaceae bacterium]|nr:hypothetical protein [Prevotellaceae bacterium]
MKNLKTLITLFLLVIGTSASWAIDDFEIDLMQENPTLPAGVEATDDGAHGPNFNGGHGWANYVFKFTTTESVKITMQKCAYGANNGILACVRDGANGDVLGSLTTQSDACSGEASWTYVSDGSAKELYVHCGAYCHKVKVEKVVAPTAVKNFEINLKTENPVLPTGVKKIGYSDHGAYYHQDDHGWCWYGVEFYVDSEVEITIGGCNYQNGYYGYLASEDGTKIDDITNDKCDGSFSYKYSGEPQTLKLYCGQYCPSIKVSEVKKEATVEERTAVWNWKTASYNSSIMAETNILARTGTIHSNLNGIVLIVDATKNGRFDTYKSGNVNIAQMSEGVIIKVPVQHVGDVVTVNSPANQFNYTVGGVKATGTTTVYNVTEEDALNGFILIEATGNNAKLYYISVKQLSFKSELTKIKLNSAGWASFTSLMSSTTLKCPIGTTAYVATDVDGETVTLTEVTKFTFGQGVFLKGDPNAEIYPVVTDGQFDVPSESAGNITVGCIDDIELFTESGAYVVATNSATGQAGFFRVVGNNIIVPAGKAYLYGPAEVDSKNIYDAKMLKIVFANGEEATGIESVIATKPAPTVFYNLSGQKVGKNYKGVVIGNDGSKYVK